MLSAAQSVNLVCGLLHRRPARMCLKLQKACKTLGNKANDTLIIHGVRSWVEWGSDC